MILVEVGLLSRPCDDRHDLLGDEEVLAATWYSACSEGADQHRFIEVFLVPF